jgi:hypothetical protein
LYIDGWPALFHRKDHNKGKKALFNWRAIGRALKCSGNVADMSHSLEIQDNLINCGKEGRTQNLP